MFRRLFLTFGLLVLVLLGVPALLLGALAGRDDLRAAVWAVLGGAAAAGLLAVLGLSAWVARRSTRPLRALMKAAEGVGVEAAGQRVFPESRDEVGQLGRVFNRMSERLAERIARLEEDRQQLRTILSGMVEGVVALDAEQRILFANDRATELLEFPARATVGRRLWEVVRHRPLLDVVSRALGSPEASREELKWNGSINRSLTVHAARLPGPPPRGAVLVLHDTSELRRLERVRQEFVANVSHELKTPLSVIKANVETLLLGAVEDAEHRGQFLDRIARQSDRLHALILDLLSLARIESGDELFDFRAVPLAGVLRACLERHRPRAEARGQTLALEDGGGDPAVWADEEALDQIFDNLVDNAVKYTPPGGQIRVSWRDAAEVLCVDVADTGIGIPEADLPRVFERFYRVDKARSREMGGTGLGLSIVKHLVGAMHGSVRAASTVGRGTTFTVCLPRAPSPQPVTSDG
jgi:two-component system phosphate regulon sensor histidine kinase PhoR